jgi:hypothetical protein
MELIYIYKTGGNYSMGDRTIPTLRVSFRKNLFRFNQKAGEILNLKDGDKILFAFDKKDKILYCFTKTNHSNGYVVKYRDKSGYRFVSVEVSKIIFARFEFSEQTKYAEFIINPKCIDGKMYKLELKKQ